MQHNLIRQILSLIDLTSLNEADDFESIKQLCQRAQTSYGEVAAVCVYPRFVKLCVEELSSTSIQIATVANFPTGNDSLTTTAEVIQQAIVDGANEIDVVFPYQKYLAGDKKTALQFVKDCKALTPNQLLKVILESGAFSDMNELRVVSEEVLLAGADFIKTSTGKISTGATLPAVTAMLMAIKEIASQLNSVVGLKVSGGIRTVEEALSFLNLVKQIMGPKWISPRTFRIGTSRLLDELLSSEKK